TVPFHDPCDGAKDTRPSVNWFSFPLVSPRNPEAFPHVNDGRATSTISTAPTSATARFLTIHTRRPTKNEKKRLHGPIHLKPTLSGGVRGLPSRSEEHTSELQSRFDLVCRLLL